MCFTHCLLDKYKENKSSYLLERRKGKAQDGKRRIENKTKRS